FLSQVFVLELLVEGKSFGIQRTAATDETVLDTEEVLQKLRDEGLVMRPESVASGGVKFELVATESLANQMLNPKARRLPPICLQRREKTRKKKRNLTYERIVEKLEKAEERRKQQEEERLSKVTSKERIDEVSNVVVQQAEEKRLKQNEKMEAITKSREKHLQALQSKLRAHEERAQKVRQRKKSLSKVPTIPEDQELMDRFQWGFGEEEKAC
ncbi:uncharacterized protein KIAA1211 homolog, partial [Limulus polyphemus]|uniref:Uncharacterized protein KIAA1211 homolog n=1 Tax=Limulus polyphemus TaxID=6850 RepID=A0ABM1C157_LIMPO